MSQDNLMKLQCSECRSVNYFSRKNKKKLKEKLELNKHCKKCRAHKVHKEIK